MTNQNPYSPHVSPIPDDDYFDFDRPRKRHRNIVVESKQKFANRQVQKGRRFVWQTNDGDLISPRRMATEHLFYAFRMLFNHTVPPAFRVGIFKRRGDVAFWPMDYKAQAMKVLRDEFMSRALTVGDLWMKHEMSDMQENAEWLITFGQVVKQASRACVESVINGAPPYDFEAVRSSAMRDFPPAAPRRRATRAKSLKRVRVRSYFRFGKKGRYAVRGYYR